MKIIRAIALVIIVTALLQLTSVVSGSRVIMTAEAAGGLIDLPDPETSGGVSVGQALHDRRSVREYSGEPLTLPDVSQLLWAAQGITGRGNLRTAPSAGGLYPLEVYLAAGKVEGLAPGVYKYLPADHALKRTADGDRRGEVSDAAVSQQSARDAAADIVIAGVYERTTAKYNRPVRDDKTGSSYPDGVKYVHMEAGHASQNVYLEAQSRGLGTVTIGAIDEGAMRKATGMPEEERPLYVMPVGVVNKK